MHKAFLEIGALFETHWTGIPNVVAAIANGALSDGDIDWSFVYDDIEIPRASVEHFLRQRSGIGGLKMLADIAWQSTKIHSDVARDAVCIFPNIKPVRRFYGKEAAIIHDLSPILAPQYHNADNIIHFAYRIRSDIETSDHLFCVSNATMQDVHAYFAVPFDRMSILPLGVDVNLADISAAKVGLRGDLQIEPYIVVVGTLEPRKNGRIILDYLRENPGFAHRYRIVFIGRDGWLDEKIRLMQVLAEVGVAADRVVFAGFVSEADKTSLILNSRFCVYPSFFEGFGLPVLEAAALGKITVCSNSSSISEVAPDKCVFFNPAELHEFGDALRVADLRSALTRSSSQSLPDIVERSAPLGWHRCYPEIAGWVRQQ